MPILIHIIECQVTKYYFSQLQDIKSDFNKKLEKCSCYSLIYEGFEKQIR